MATYLDTWSISRSHKLSAWQQLQLALQKQPEQTLIGSLDPATLGIVVDVSHWNGDIDVATLKAGGVGLVSPKASDGKKVRPGGDYELSNYVDDKFDQNVQLCYDAGVPCMPYHYVQPAFPNYTVQGTIDWNWECIKAGLKNKIPKKSFHAYMLDVEERTASDLSGSDVVLGLLEKLRTDDQTKDVPIVVYTSMSILNYYTKLREQLSFQGANKNLFMAQWVWNTATTTNWDTLKSYYFPKISMKVLTPGYANWKMLQWSASFVLPGCNGALDLGFYNGTDTQMKEWLGYNVTTPPPPPPPPPDTGDPDLTELTGRIIGLESQSAQHGTAIADINARLANVKGAL